MQVERQSQHPVQSATGPGSPLASSSRWRRLNAWAERLAGSVFILPAVLVVLFLAIFPLIISLYLSLSRFKFVKGGFEINFAGLANYRKLLVGSQQSRFLGVLAPPSPAGWLVFGIVVVLLLLSLVRYVRSGSLSIEIGRAHV